MNKNRRNHNKKMKNQPVELAMTTKVAGKEPSLAARGC